RPDDGGRPGAAGHRGHRPRAGPCADAADAVASRRPADLGRAPGPHPGRAARGPGGGGGARVVPRDAGGRLHDRQRGHDRRRALGDVVRSMTDAVNLLELEELARGVMDPAAFAYVAGGAGDERTMADNRAAFARRRIEPRVLRGFDAVDLTTDVLGGRLAMPVL